MKDVSKDVITAMVTLYRYQRAGGILERRATSAEENSSLQTTGGRGGGGTHLSLPWEAQAAKLFASKEFSPKASLPIEVVYGGGERGSLEN